MLFSAATALFVVAALPLIALSVNDALSAVSAAGASALAPAAAPWTRALLLVVTLCSVATGAALWFVGRKALQRTEASAAALAEQAEALRQSEQRYRAIIDHAVVGLMRVAADGRIMSANPALAGMLGYDSGDELVGRNVSEFYRDPEDRARLLDAIGNQSSIAGMALAWRRRDGSAVTVRVTSRLHRDASGTLITFDDIIEDVTERAAVGEQLRHAQKMEAVGRLAAGIAHDFNNLLTVILGNLDLLASDASLSPAGAHCVEQIRQATTSVAAVTKQLLMFSSKGLPSPQPVNVNQAVAYVEKMIARLIGEDIRVFANLSPAAGTVLVDPAHLEQALINLAVNARDAMPEGGVLIFETSVVDDGRRVRIAVRDSGHGMDDATRQRAFEPFFTTKPPGKGTGLGLSMVYGFVQQGGGTVHVSSTVGRGTIVTLEFPAASASLPSQSETTISTEPGTERVLVVEDQDSVRALVSGVLEKRGYKVLQAPNAREARRILTSEPSVDLVITDVVLPGESGIELAEWLRTAYPAVRVTFMSGYSDHPGMYSVAGDNLLRKPFTPSGLAAHVRSVLDGRSSDAGAVSSGARSDRR